MRRIHVQASVMAKFDMPISVLGESGTGKEVLSLLIHQALTSCKLSISQGDLRRCPRRLAGK